MANHQIMHASPFLPASFLLMMSWSLAGQSARIPTWFQDELRYQVGTWSASNAAYVGAQEPMTEYRVEWAWGEHRNTLKGRLYGMIDGKPTRPFWEFYQYWDPARQQAVFQQVGQDGTLGTGTLGQDDPRTTRLVQTFTSPDGIVFRMGHHHQILHPDQYQGNSFRIDSAGTWHPDRQYLWTRMLPVADTADCTCCLPPYREFDFWLGEWKVTDSIGTFVGTNRIQKNLDHCLLEENWQSKGSNRGRSMNYYDPADRRWHQLWIDNQGSILHLSGQRSGTDMVLESDWQTEPDVPRYKHRITWSPRPDGTVVQTWQMLDADEGVLQTLFQGIYTRWPRVGEE